MESQYQKWVTLSYLALAGLVAYIVFSTSGKLVSMYDIEARVRNIDLILRVGSVFVGAIALLALYRSDQANQFMNEVMEELSRVTWPTQKETSSATFIVIVMVVVSGMILGFLDYCWTQVIKWVL
jgi:preprotein translocase subunit SecE